MLTEGAMPTLLLDWHRSSAVGRRRWVKQKERRAHDCLTFALHATAPSIA